MVRMVRMVTPPTDSQTKSVFQQLRLGPDMVNSLLIFLTFSTTFCLCRPGPSDKMEINVESPQDGSLGGDLDMLITDIFNRIIQRRLENLLQGVSSPINRLESSEFFLENEVNEKPASEEGKEFLEINLPVSVTEIPSEVFTNLPGRHFCLFLSSRVNCLLEKTLYSPTVVIKVSVRRGSIGRTKHGLLYLLFLEQKKISIFSILKTPHVPYKNFSSKSYNEIVSGYWLVENMNVNNLTDHQEDNVQEYNNEKDFLTESYQISDLFS